LSIRKLPDYQQKQKILYSKDTEPQTLKDYGDLFFAEGKYADAFDFYLKANYIEGIEKIRLNAFETGDVMLFQQAAKGLQQEISSADWQTIGQTAMNLKKYFFAGHALEKANNEELLTALKKIMHTEEQEKI